MTRLLLVLLALAACGSRQPAVSARQSKPEVACEGAAPVVPSRMEVLLTEDGAAAGGLGSLHQSFDISPRRLALIADHARMYLLGWGGVVPIEGIPGDVEAFAYTTDGLLLVVRGTTLMYLGEAGTLETLFELPSPNMRIATGPAGVMYLFEQRSVDAHYGLYAVEHGRRVRKLFESPEPIDDVASAGRRLYIATGGAVFDVSPGEPMKLVVNLGGSMIRSVAADDVSGTLYFSDATTVYAMTTGCVAILTNEVAGSLRVRDGALLVLDPSRTMFVRFALAPPS